MGVRSCHGSEWTIERAEGTPLPRVFLQRRDCNLRCFRVYYALGDDDMYQALYRKYRPHISILRLHYRNLYKNQLQYFKTEFGNYLVPSESKVFTGTNYRLKADTSDYTTCRFGSVYGTVIYTIFHKCRIGISSPISLGNEYPYSSNHLLQFFIICFRRFSRCEQHIL